MRKRMFRRKEINNSFFLIDRRKRIIFSDTDALEKLHILDKEPSRKQPIIELIPARYLNSFDALIDYCFEGNTAAIKRNFKVSRKASIVMQVTGSPISINSKIPYVLITILCDNEVHLFDDYSHFTSHQLRAPLSNILSLSDIVDESKLTPFDSSHIKELLNDINRQAKKLDSIIVTLNSLINSDNESRLSKNKQLKRGISHIVLVDDDPLVNKLHSMMMAKHNDGKTIVSFDDPYQALDYVIDNSPDLILLDLNMPGMDGFQFLENLRQKSVKVDVIVVSSSIDQNEKVKVLAYESVVDFYSKPLTNEKVGRIFND